MSEEEARNSADCFPIEFEDMKARRRVLKGRDVVATLSVDRRNWRVQIEHELRSKLLRLRQQAAAVLSDRDRLLKLCLDSFSTFVVLWRHALLYSGRNVPAAKRLVVHEGSARCWCSAHRFRIAPGRARGERRRRRTSMRYRFLAGI